MTREDAYAAARAELDMALARIAADLAAGRLTPEQAAHVRRCDRSTAPRPAALAA